MMDAEIKFTKDLVKAINDALQKELEIQFEEMMKGFNARKAEIVAGVLLSVERDIQANHFGESITFTIKQVKN